MQKLKNWTKKQKPPKKIINGKFCRLEPINEKKHTQQLFNACTAKQANQRFKYLPETKPKNIKEFRKWIKKAQNSKDPIYFVVICKKTKKVEGRQTLMRIDQENGVIEIGHIYWGDKIAKTPAATEAFFLFAKLVFDELGYRRFEWKCNDLNEPSKKAAKRFGMKFEGTFRQAAVVKGKNRDTAWFSIIDKEWKKTKQKFEKWLKDTNFDQNGKQIKKLKNI